MVGLPEGEKTLRISVYTQYRRVTDEQTDGQTRTMPRAMHTRRAVN